MIKRADAEGYPWALAGENVICSIFQAFLDFEDDEGPHKHNPKQ